MCRSGCGAADEPASILAPDAGVGRVRDLRCPRGDRNPLAVTASHLYIIAAFPFIFFCFASVVVAAIIAVRRFRRSSGQERQQFKWLAASAGLLVVTLPFAVAFNWSRVAGAVFTVQLIAALLAGTYLAVVIGLQAVFSSFAGGSNLAIAVSTLVVAALFLPVRSRVQGFVDRRFYRRRYDAQRTLESFGSRLREQVELETLSADLRGVVEETMQPAHMALWLREGAR